MAVIGHRRKNSVNSSGFYMNPRLEVWAPNMDPSGGGSRDP